MTPQSDVLPARSTSRGDREVGGERSSVAVPLTVMVTCALLVLMQLYLAIPLVPVLSEEFGAGVSAALATAYGLAYALGFLVWGPISDRYGRKVILVPGMLALAVATGLLAVAPSLGVVAGLRAVQGFVAASFAVVILAYVGEALPPRWRTTGIGAISTAFLVAGIVGQVYAQVVALSLGWRWVFGLAAAAFALAAAGLGTVLGEPYRAATSTTLVQRFAQLRSLVVRRELALPYAASFTILLAFVAMYAALGPQLQEQFGLDPNAILLVRLAGLPGMALAPVAGALIGRVGPVRVAVAGFLLAALGLMGEALAAESLWALAVTSAVLVAGTATTVPALITLVGSRAGKARASSTGIYGFVLFAGASVGPLTLGLPLGFTGLLLALAALLLGGAALVATSAPRT